MNAVSSAAYVVPEAPPAGVSEKALVLLGRIARCAYVIDQHRRGIAINSQRIAEAQAALERLETQP